jgi:hypothetical protein
MVYAPVQDEQQQQQSSPQKKKQHHHYTPLEEKTTRKHPHVVIPNLLALLIRDFIKRWRPILLARAKKRAEFELKGLWISMNGACLTPRGVQRSVTTLVNTLFSILHITPAAFRRYFVTMSLKYQLSKEGMTHSDFVKDFQEYLNTSNDMFSYHYDRNDNLDVLAETHAVVEESTYLSSSDAKLLKSLVEDFIVEINVKEKQEMFDEDDDNEEETDEQIIAREEKEAYDEINDYMLKSQMVVERSLRTTFERLWIKKEAMAEILHLQAEVSERKKQMKNFVLKLQEEIEREQSDEQFKKNIVQLMAKQEKREIIMEAQRENDKRHRFKSEYKLEKEREKRTKRTFLSMDFIREHLAIVFPEKNEKREEIIMQVSDDEIVTSPSTQPLKKKKEEVEEVSLSEKELFDFDTSRNSEENVENENREEMDYSFGQNN